MKKSNKEKYQEALSRARGSFTMSNYPAIFQGFMNKGIPEDQIEPRVNVLTYDAWKALGRYVKRGEHGVRILTFVKIEKEIEENGEKKVEHYSRPWSTVVFHISQTEQKEEVR